MSAISRSTTRSSRDRTSLLRRLSSPPHHRSTKCPPRRIIEGPSVLSGRTCPDKRPRALFPHHRSFPQHIAPPPDGPIRSMSEMLVGLAIARTLLAGAILASTRRRSPACPLIHAQPLARPPSRCMVDNRRRSEGRPTSAQNRTGGPFFCGSRPRCAASTANSIRAPV